MVLCQKMDDRKYTGGITGKTFLPKTGVRKQFGNLHPQETRNENWQIFLSNKMTECCDTDTGTVP